MVDPVLAPAALLHFFALTAGFVWVCRRWRLPAKEDPFFVPLLLWACLVLTGHLSGLGGQLGNLFVYVPASFLSAAALFFFFDSARKTPSPAPLLSPPTLSFDPLASPKLRRSLFWFLAVTLGLFACVSVVLAMSVYPDNADSMIYRLPRAFWYVSNGSFLHPFESLIDKRLVFYPLDGVALYVPFVLYALPGTFHSLPSLLAWFVIVYATYRFARELGASKLIGLFSAWLVGTTPGILAQATSTNDEIIAAAALLLCFYMGWRWLLSGDRLYFLFSALALGLSAGTKMHILFLAPTGFLFFFLMARAVYLKPERLKLWAQAVGLRTAVLSVLAVAVMFAPFLFYNYASTGHFYFFSDFKNEVFNLSASLRIGGQNLLIYLSQMILSPIADLNFWPVANDRQAFNNALNEIFNPLIEPFLSKDPSFYHMTYRFVGITLPVSVRFVEFSLWSAFVWLLWPLQAALVWKQKKFPLRAVFCLLALTPLLWLFFWSLTTLYMEGTATYFSFYLICAAPAAATVFLRVRRAIWNDLRWVALSFVVLSNLIVCHNLLMYSGFRAVPDLFYAKSLPFDWLLTDKPIIDEIRAARRIRVAFTHEKTPYFGYMHWNPKARFETPYGLEALKKDPDYESVLHLLPASGLHRYGFAPLKIEGKKTRGVVYLGVVRGIGREAVFAVGNGVEGRHPNEADYIVLGTTFGREKGGGWTVLFGGDPAGFSFADQLTFEYEARQKGKVIFHRLPEPNPTVFFRTETNPQEEPVVLTIIVRDEKSGKEASRATYPLGGRGTWLPESGDY